jgi:hypothetical protein
MLVVAEDGVTEGMFSPNVWSGQIIGTDLGDRQDRRREWLGLVREYSAARVPKTE